MKLIYISKKQKILIIAFLALIIGVAIALSLTFLSQREIDYKSFDIISYPEYKPISNPVDLGEKKLKVTKTGDFSEFNIKIPTINVSFPVAGSITGYYLDSYRYDVKESEFKLSVEEENLAISFRANPGESGFGFVPYISQKECFVVESLDSIEMCRILAEETGTITEYNYELGNNYNYLYHYTDSYGEGVACGTIEGYSCPNPYFKVKDQLFQLICGVNNVLDVKMCDEFISNLFIEKIANNQ